jgi:mono/diheme cytochrome c family protein
MKTSVLPLSFRVPIMNRLLKPLVLVTALIAAASGYSADAPRRADRAADVLARGRYLVERVGMCADCHSVRNEKGQFVAELWLQGAPLGFAPTVPMPAWASAAPAIAGLPTMTDEQALAFFTSGARPDGSHSRPPMPEYRFERADAEAVVAYLRSLAKK